MFVAFTFSCDFHSCIIIANSSVILHARKLQGRVRASYHLRDLFTQRTRFLAVKSLRMERVHIGSHIATARTVGGGQGQRSVTAATCHMSPDLSFLVGVSC